MAESSGGSHGRRRWLVAGGVVVVALVIGGLLVWRAYRDTATQVAVDDILEEFRASTTDAGPPGSTVPSTAAPTSAPALRQPALPEVGVYVYATTGGESVDALGGAEHRYPAETTITVSRTGCGVVLRWVALEERSEEWDLCVDEAGGGGGFASSYYEAYHQFFGRDDRRRYECPTGTILPATFAPGASWERTCSSGDRDEIIRTEVIGVESLTIDGQLVEAVHLRLASELVADDGTVGAAETDVWLHPTSGLPLRHVERGVTTSPQVIGDVHYEERFELVLTTLEPRR